MHHLTGFQQVAELAATAPFCLLIVTHKLKAIFLMETQISEKSSTDLFRQFTFIA